MKKSVVSLFLVLTVVFSLLIALGITASAAVRCPSGFWTDEGNYDTVWRGSGTENDPYLISSEAELAGLAYQVNSIPKPTETDSSWDGNANHFSGKYFRLTRDLDLSAHYWVPIGYDFMGGYKRLYCTFEGYFDGDGHKISGMIQDNTVPETPYQKAFGLFGVVGGVGLHYEKNDTGEEPKAYYDHRTQITDLSVSGSINVEAYAKKGLMIGGISAFAYFCDISGCTADMDITLKQPYNDGDCLKAGIIVGDASECDFADCVSNGSLQLGSKESYLPDDGFEAIAVSGIVGDLRAFVDGVEISSCTNNAAITVYSSVTEEHRVGGIFGRSRICTKNEEKEPTNVPTVLVQNCVNNGAINVNFDYASKNNNTGLTIGGVGGLQTFSSYYNNLTADWAIRTLRCTNNAPVTVTAKIDSGRDMIACCVGGILGRGKSCHIEDCINNAAGVITVTGVTRGGNAGGITGDLMNAQCLEDTIVGSVNHGDIHVEGSHCFVGGITGRLKSDTILNCYNDGNIDVCGYFSAFVGGLAGHIARGNDLSYSTSMILNSYNLGDLSAKNQKVDEKLADCETRAIFVGGLAGYACTDHYRNSDSVYLLENSYNAGSLSCENAADYDAFGIGGIFGTMSSETNDWTVSIDPAELPAAYDSDTKEGGKQLVIKNCGWLDTCGATYDYITAGQSSSSCSKSASGLSGNFLTALNNNRAATIADGDSYLNAYSLPALNKEAKQWGIGESGYPEFIEVKDDNASVHVADTLHGKVTVSAKKAPTGKLITVTVKPDKGYTLETLTVESSRGKQIELTEEQAGEIYTFKMPNVSVTVTATFMEDNTVLNYFVDVQLSDYFYDAALWAAKNNVTKGVDDLHFAPYVVTTRVQLVTFLWRAAGCPEPQTKTCAFKDVDGNAYYYKAVLWAVEKGIVKGTSVTTFSPNAPVTRGQIVAFLARYKGVTDEATGYTHSFTDVTAADYYNNAVAWAAANGIAQGITKTTFAPNRNCLRGEAVTFLWRCLAR